MMKQKEAVFQAVTNTCKPSEGGKYIPTTEQKAIIYAILLEAFRAGEVELDKAFDEKYVAKYIPGLVNNWLRKDLRLSGGVKYTPKNPGSRAGSGDATVKAMRLLLKQKTDASERAEIQEYIDQHVAALKPKVEPLTAEQVEILRSTGLAHLIPTGTVVATPVTTEVESSFEESEEQT